MTRWTGIVLALSESAGEEMASRLATYLHPVAGRPLVWHAASSLAALDPAPERVIVLAGLDLAPGVFQDIPVPVEVHHFRAADRAGAEELLSLDAAGDVLVLDASALAHPDELGALLRAPVGSWLPADPGREAAGARLAASQLPQLLQLDVPLQAPGDALAEPFRLDPRSGSAVLLVRDRAGLARATQLVRDRLVRALMSGGVTFLLPESVLVDVDVRIGRDSVVYPGAVLEGQTTVGEETVIGPGCRILDSWVGSGVELRGWNYISHTSIRNRAILEPYVRRGFD